MKIIADTHTHSLISGHAYSTIQENFIAAAQKGFQFIACTEHTQAMPGAPFEFYFTNLRVLPDQLMGVYLLRGCEVNILNSNGDLDLPDSVLQKLDWVIASLHSPVYSPSDIQSHTQAWMQVAKNPHVDVIGHCGDERYKFDYEPVICSFAENGKIVEINSHSFHFRPGSMQNCREIAKLCAKYKVPVVVSSDAHFYASIGDFSDAINMLEEIEFPQELILNADYDRFANMLHQKTGRVFPRLNVEGKCEK